jgi:hypothetical protein
MRKCEDDWFELELYHVESLIKAVPDSSLKTFQIEIRQKSHQLALKLQSVDLQPY